jgi:type IV pilus assembly protein PilB
VSTPPDIPAHAQDGPPATGTPRANPRNGADRRGVEDVRLPRSGMQRLDPGPLARARPAATAPAQAAPQARTQSLSQVLLGLQYITVEQLRGAFPDGPPQGGRLGELLIERGLITREQLAHASAVRAGVGLFEPGTPVDSSVTELIDARTVRRYQAVPVRIDPDGRLVVAMADPSNVLALDDLRIITGREIRPLLAPPDEITHLLGETRRLDSVLAGVDDATNFADVRVTDYMVDDGDAANDDAPVVRLVNSILARGVDEGASDVHFEPQANDMVVRFRVDGVLRNVTTVPSRFSHGIASRIKIMADLDIAERRAPQDGRVGLYVTGRNLDLRVATLPTVYGEKIVIRILDRTNLVMDLRDLGFTNEVLTQFEAIYRRPHGALLVTGPTGSGKSTTLYGTLNQLNSVEQNIITVEDPVEYRLPGINQVQVNPKAGLSFAAGLRSILRCDPDVIMIGEVRDPETAKIAIESALTGHLVLATLHTNDSAGALSRLSEMGVEGFLSASAVAGILAQRLARRLCVHCREPHQIPTSVFGELVDPTRMPTGLGDTAQVYRPIGCARCGGSGYKGRLGVYELLVVSEAIAEMIVTGASADAITHQAQREGMRTLREDGLVKVLRGDTSLEELARAVG